MNHADALKHIRTLVHVASEIDNLVLACFDPQWPNLIFAVA
jgi:hypothetical protein